LVETSSDSDESEDAKKVGIRRLKKATRQYADDKAEVVQRSNPKIEVVDMVDFDEVEEEDTKKQSAVDHCDEVDLSH